MNEDTKLIFYPVLALLSFLFILIVGDIQFLENISGNAISILRLILLLIAIYGVIMFLEVLSE